MTSGDDRSLTEQAVSRVLVRLAAEGNDLLSDAVTAADVKEQVARVVQAAVARSPAQRRDRLEAASTAVGMRRAASAIHPTASLRAATICFEETFPLLLGGMDPESAAYAVEEANLLQEALGAVVLQASTEYVDYLLTRLDSVHLQERRAIAAHLHDRTAQSIASAMQRLQYETIPMADVREILGEALSEIRSVALGLRQFVGDRRIDEALDDFLSDLGSDEHLVDLTRSGQPFRFPALQQETVYSIIREAVLNALKHAKAARIEIHLTWSAHSFSARIADDGIGFRRASTAGSRMGLLICRERAEAVKAELEIRSTPGMGTVVELLLPL